MLILAVGASACDRNVEKFDPNETSRPPDLSRIFPAPEQAMGQGAGQSAGGQASSMRANLPPSRTEAGGAEDAPAAGESIRGRIVASPELGEGRSGSVLFLIARSYGAAGGPPMAVVRVPGASLPLDFEIGPANVMIPSMRFAGQIQLEARLDGDGNAMTKEAGDLVAEIVGPLEPGATDVEIVLSRKL